MSKFENQTRASFSPWPHRAAVALCCAAFPLIWLGGLVTTYDAGMAVPDWPTTYGYNLFLYPWQTWLLGPFDLFIEHGHRLLGAAVGLLGIGLVVSVMAWDVRRAMRYAAAILLGMIVAQGVMGGLRVRLDERNLALVHACLGMATFAFAAAMAVVTSRYWREGSIRRLVSSDVSHAAGPADGTASGPAALAGQRVLRAAALTAALVFVQVILGAMLRHVPVAATPAYFQLAVILHVVLGLAVMAHAVSLVLRGERLPREAARLANSIRLMGALIVVQIALGGATWVLNYGWPWWLSEVSFAASYTIRASSLAQAMVTTLHVAVGALILAVSVVSALRAWLFFRLAPPGPRWQESGWHALSTAGREARGWAGTKA
jgi:cytochrome c oxidase assembly protein subunit 15